MAIIKFTLKQVKKWLRFYDILIVDMENSNTCYKLIMISLKTMKKTFHFKTGMIKNK